MNRRPTAGAADRLRSAADLRSVLDLAADLADLDGGEAIAPVLLRGLAGTVGADAATLTHLHLDTQHEVVVRWPAVPPDKRVLEGYPVLGHTHPLRAPIRSMPRPPAHPDAAVRISDVLSERAWRASALHRDVMTGTADQLCLPLHRRDGAVRAVTLTRHAGTFTDRQRDLLVASGPHVAAALRRAPVNRTMGFQLAPRPGWVPLSTAPGVHGLAPSPPRDDAEEPRRPADAGNPGTLSGRESQVLALVVDGLTDAQIARRLDLRPSTVSRHLHRIYSRHGLANRAAAARFYGSLALAGALPAAGTPMSGG